MNIFNAEYFNSIINYFSYEKDLNISSTAAHILQIWTWMIVKYKQVIDRQYYVYLVCIKHNKIMLYV